MDLKADSFTQSVDLRVDLGVRQSPVVTVGPASPPLINKTGLRMAALGVARRARRSLWPPTLRKEREPLPPKLTKSAGNQAGRCGVKRERAADAA